KAEKSELTNYVDKQQYNEKIGQLDVSINGITGTVSDIKADVDKNTGDIKSANSKIAKVEQTANGLTTTVSNISADVNKAKQDITKVEQTAGRIESTVSSIETELETLEIGAVNLLTNLEENWEQGSINSSSGEASGSSTSWIRTKDYSPIEQGRMVTISSPEFYNIYFFEYDINHNFLELVQTGYTNERTFKLNSNTAYFKVSSRNRDSSNMETSILGKELKVQVEYGTKATTWKDALVDNEARMVAVETSIKQLPDEIDLSVKEGLRGVGNLVKNPELTESTEGWNSGNGLRYMKVTYGEFDGTGALRSEAETNTQTYS